MTWNVRLLEVVRRNPAFKDTVCWRHRVQVCCRYNVRRLQDPVPSPVWHWPLLWRNANDSFGHYNYPTKCWCYCHCRWINSNTNTQVVRSTQKITIKAEQKSVKAGNERCGWPGLERFSPATVASSVASCSPAGSGWRKLYTCTCHKADNSSDFSAALSSALYNLNCKIKYNSPKISSTLISLGRYWLCLPWLRNATVNQIRVLHYHFAYWWTGDKYY